MNSALSTVEPHLAGQRSRELQVRAFGEVVSLGMGYNELEERFVSGVFVLPCDLIDKYRTETKVENCTFEVTTDDSIEKKRKHFDLSGEASAKLSLGIKSFNIHGAAKYIDDHRSTTNTARLVLNYKSRSGTETLPLSDVSNTAYRKDAIINAEITHVVTCIQYGADAFLLFDRRESNTSSRTLAEGELKTALDYLCFSGSIGGSGNLTEDQLKRARSSAVTFYGDVMLDKNPTTFDEAVAVYKDLPAMIKAIRTRPGSSLFGVPQIVTLTPLSHLGLDAPRRRYAQLQDAISTRLSRLMQQSLNLSARLESLVDFEGVYAQLPDEAKEEIDSVRNLTAEHIASFKLEMSDLLPEFAVGNVTKERVLQEVMAFEKSAYFSGILSDYITRKECEFTALHHYLDQLNQFAKPAYDYSSIIGLTLDKDVDRVVAFSLSDILTRKLNAESALLNNTRLADSWCRSSDAAFTAKLKQSIQAFADLAKSKGHGVASRTRYIYTQSGALPPNVFPAGDDTLGLMALFEHNAWQALYWPEEGDRSSASTSDHSRFFKSAQKLQITEGKDWYQVPMNEVHANRSQLYKRFDVGEGKVMHPKKVIVMVGATGAGKTTLINGMTNYVFGIQHECDFRLQLVSSETERPETQSQTEIISEYVLHAFHDSPVPYTVTLVDTPGFGDTRGIKQDEKLMDMLRALFQDNIQVVDAFCFVVKASDARLTATQTYIFNSVLSIFGNDVLPNIFIMITFADAMTPPVMGALREFDMHNQNYFKFNNCVFSVKQDTATGSDVNRQGPQSANEHAINRMFWMMAYESYANFFVSLGKVESRSVALTCEVLEKRRKLEKEIEILSQCINQGLNELTKMRSLVPVVEELLAREASNKNYRRRVKVPKTRRVHFTNTGTKQRFVMNCMVCGTTCHADCSTASDEDKASCSAMDKSGNCRVCRSKCHWSKHVSRDFYFEDYEGEEEVTVDSMKQEYDAAVEELSAQDNVLLGIAQEYDKVQKQVVLSMKKVTDCLNELDRIALRKNLLTTVDYVDELIRATRQEKKPGWESRLVQLQKARERAELISKITEKDFDPLKFNDPELKAILANARDRKEERHL